MAGLGVRPPTPGFVYLLSVVTASVAALWFLGQPGWYELHGRPQKLAEARFVLGLAKAETNPANRLGYLSSAFQLFFGEGDWQGSADTLGYAYDCGAPLTAVGLEEILEGRCWATGLTGERRTKAGQTACFLLHNGAPERTATVFSWERQGSGRAEYALAKGEWRELPRDGKLTVTMAASSNRLVAFRVVVAAPNKTGSLRLTSVRGER